MKTTTISTPSLLINAYKKAIMETKPLQKMFPFLCIILLMVSCASTNRLTISVTEPAPVSIPKNISRVGILNRFNNTSDNVISKIDEVFSAEGKNFDRDASNKVIEGLNELLKQQDRFDVVIVNDSLLVSNNTVDFPTALTWDTVEQLCKASDVDVLYVLSFFDTDSKISYNTKQAFSQNVLGVKIPVLEHHATANTLIKGGFKIYDPTNRLILDSFSFSKGITTSGKGINPAKALEALKMRKDLVMDASRLIGENYALSIVPYRTRVARDYFVKGTDQFEIAKRKAQTGDWDGAALHWERELANPKSKIAGRACYNMAIINEINGDIETAIEWASKAYSDYNNKEALRYLNILKYRVSQNQRLAEQNYNTF
ncbi:DUF6340 family protein [Aestuariivivens sp. NBU2969]|uniref:DUF6340 family protein n=2 Tax=Aestuariivivens TaxID=1820275 RepID=UPI001CBB3599|nr:DUF6340 family protein [Aestuariivivens sp. NBU2969]